MFSNYSITNEELGAKVKVAHQNHLKRVAAMRPQWTKEGKEFRADRENLHISRSELSRHIGVCPQVIAKFEQGESVRSRNMLKQSYLTSLQLIQLERDNSVHPMNNK